MTRTDKPCERFAGTWVSDFDLASMPDRAMRKASVMNWLGTWRNQYGSLVTIARCEDDRVEGTFTTALEDSGFFGQSVPIIGGARGNCIALASVASGASGDMVVSYTGLFRDGKLETVWHYLGDEALIASGEGERAERRPVPWWRAMITNVDTFVRSEAIGQSER